VFSFTYWNIIKFTGIVLLTTISWIIVTFLTQPNSEETLRNFYRKIRPGGPGWKAVVDRAQKEGLELVKEKDIKWDVPTGILCMILGSMAIYSTLFAIGNLLYGKVVITLIFSGIAVLSTFILTRLWKKLISSN
jgi:hypothetical protein